MSAPETADPPQDAPRRRLLHAAGLLALLQAWPARAQGLGATDREAALAALLRQGGCALLIRHALTEPGIGDPPGFRLDDCRSQRQLSLAGREQARSIGRWFESRQLQPAAVLSSQWCRCKDTAELAFGRVAEWTALNSTFTQGDRQPAQTRELQARLPRIAEGRFEVWVTHQVNMTHLTGQYPSMGEAFVVDRSGCMRGRHAFA